MPGEVLSYEIQLKLDKLIGGYQQLARVMNSVNEAMSVKGQQDGINVLVSQIHNAVRSINDEFKKISLGDLGKNISSMSANIQTISDNIVAHLNKIGQQQKKIDQYSMKGLKAQLDNLSASIGKFGEIAKGGLAQAFKDVDVQNATKSLKKYVDVLEQISKLNIKNLNEIDLSNINTQLKSFIGQFESLTSASRRIGSLSDALNDLKKIQPDNLDSIGTALESIQKKAQAARQAVTGGSKLSEKLFSQSQLNSFVRGMEDVNRLVSQYSKAMKDTMNNSAKGDNKTSNFLVNIQKSFDSLNATLSKVNQNINRVIVSIVTSIQSLTSTTNLSPVLKQFGLFKDNVKDTFQAIQDLSPQKIVEKSKTAAQGASSTISMVKQQIQSMVDAAKIGIDNVVEALRSNQSTGRLVTSVEKISALFTRIQEFSPKAINMLRGVTKINISDEQKNSMTEFETSIRHVAEHMADLVEKSKSIADLTITPQSVEMASSYAAQIERLTQAMSGQKAAVANQDGITALVDMETLQGIIKSLDQLKDRVQLTGNGIAKIFGGMSTDYASGSKGVQSIATLLKSLNDSISGLNSSKQNGFDRMSSSVDSLIGKLGGDSGLVGKINQVSGALSQFSYNKTFNSLAQDLSNAGTGARSTSTQIQAIKRQIEGSINTNKFDTVTSKIKAIGDMALDVRNAIELMKNTITTMDLSALKSIKMPTSKAQQTSNVAAGGAMPINIDSRQVETVNLAAKSIQDLATAFNNATTASGMFNAVDDQTYYQIENISQAITVLGNFVLDIAVKTGLAGASIGDVFAGIARSVGVATQEVNVQKTSIDQLAAKFKSLSSASIAKANGFFTAFKDAGQMKEFSTNLQQLAKINAQPLNNVMVSVQQFINTIKLGESNVISEFVSSITKGFSGLNSNISSESITAIKQASEGLNKLQIKPDTFAQITKSIGELGKTIETSKNQIVEAIKGIGSLSNIVAQTTSKASSGIQQVATKIGSLDQRVGQVAGHFNMLKKSLSIIQKAKINKDTDFNAIQKQALRFENILQSLDTINKSISAGQMTKSQAKMFTQLLVIVDRYQEKMTEIRQMKSQLADQAELNAGHIINTEQVDKQAKHYTDVVNQIKRIRTTQAGDGKTTSLVVSGWDKAGKAVTVYADAAGKVTKIVTAQMQQQQHKIQNVVDAYNNMRNAMKSIDKSNVGQAQRQMLQGIIQQAQSVIAEYEKMSQAQRNVVYGAEGQQRINAARSQQLMAQASSVDKLIAEYQKLTEVYNAAAAAKAKGDMKTYDAKVGEGAAMIESMKGKYSQLLLMLPQVQAAIEQVKQAHMRMSDTQYASDMIQQYSKIGQIGDKVRDSIERMTKARQEFNAASKAGDYTTMGESAAKVQAQTMYLSEVQRALQGLKLQSAQIKKIIDLIKQATGEQKKKNDTAKVGVSIGDKMLSQLTSMIRMYIGLQGIRKLWTSAKEYATEYYDAMNEIRTVTGKTEQDAERLGQKYRVLARQLSASSTQIASAAVTYYRQGLDDDAVSERLVATTKYAKISGVEFTAAADIITSAVNTLGVSAQHASDVFIALGNSAGSSSQEIGTAMQKASASAQAAGVSFEWLGAYIATVSENTRQSAESIGTAMSTIMSRLHSIKAKGFNEDDEMKVNDVAKALSKIGVSLFDVNGQWRDMSDVFLDIAEQWGGLNDKTRSYIATVIAGTRQQNYFLSLMEDMSHITEGTSRAMELYNVALEAAGTTTQAYAIYEQSVTAANDRMKASFEALYNSLLNGNMLKDIYNFIANLVTGITNAIKATNGWNVAILAIGAGIAMLASAIPKFIAAMDAATTTAGGWVSLIAMAAGVVASLILTLADSSKQLSKYNTAMDKAKTATERFKQSQSKIKGIKNEIKETVNSTKSLVQKYVELSTKTRLTSQQQQTLKLTIEQLVQAFPSLKGVIDSTNGSYETTYENVQRVNKALKQQLLLKRHQAREQAKATIATNAEAIGELNSAISYSQDSTVPDKFQADYNRTQGKYGYKYNSSTGLVIIGKDSNGQLIRVSRDEIKARGGLTKQQYAFNQAYSELLEIKDMPLMVSMFNRDGYINERLMKRGYDVDSYSSTIFDYDGNTTDIVAQMAAQKLSRQNTETLQASRTVAVSEMIDSIRSAFDSELFAFDDPLISQYASLQTDKILEQMSGIDFSTMDAAQIQHISNQYFEKVENIMDSWIEFDRIISDPNTSSTQKNMWEQLNKKLETATKTGSQVDYKAVQQAIDEWNDNFPQLTLQNPLDNAKFTSDPSKIAQNILRSYSGDELEDQIERFFMSGYTHGGNVELDESNATRLAKVQTINVQQDGKTFSLNVTPVLPDGTELTPEQLETYVEDVVANAQNENGVFTYSAALANDTQGLIVGGGVFTTDNSDQASLVTSRIQGQRIAVIGLAEAYTDLTEEQRQAQQAAMTQAQRAAVAVDNQNKMRAAQLNGYRTQLEAINAAYEENGATGAIAYLNRLKVQNDALYNALIEDVPQLASLMAGTLDPNDIGSSLNKGLSEVQKIASKYKDIYSQLADETQWTNDTVASLLAGDKTNSQWKSNLTSALFDGLDEVDDKAAVLYERLMMIRNVMGEQAFNDLASQQGFEWMNTFLASDRTLSNYSIAQGDAISSILGTEESWDMIATRLTDTSNSLDTINEQTTMLQDIINGLSAQGGLENFRKSWKNMSSDTKKSIVDLTGLSQEWWQEFVNGSDDAAVAVRKLDKRLEHLRLKKLEQSGKIMSGVADIFDAAYEDSVKFSQGSAKLSTQMEKLTDTWGAYNYVMDQANKGTQEYDQQMSVLASSTGYSADVLKNNMGLALDWLTSHSQQAELSILGLADSLLAIAGGSFDPSTYTGGMITLGDTASAQAQQIAGLINTLMQITGVTIGWEKTGETTLADGTVLPTYRSVVTKGLNGSAGSKVTPDNNGGGGGGGGGGGNKNSGRTKEEIFVDHANWALQRLKDSATELNTIMGSWSDDGYFTSMISGYEQMNEYLEQQNKLLNEDIAQAQDWLPGLYEELAAEQVGTEAYDKILSRIKTIQSAIIEWNQNLEDNDVQLKKNKKAIDDLYDSIRQLDIDLENEVLKAIQDREKKRVDMLNARKEMEETIFEILKKQAEEQEQAILDSIEKQIDALEKEKDLVDEILSKRKEQAQTEKQMEQLRQMQEKYNRISADPTRAKEAAELLKQIQEKQDELAWKNAQNEAEYQADAIDQQIESLEDYAEYIERYYEQLLSNPRNFIDQIDNILQMSQEDILKWLEDNSDEYKNSTDTNRELIRESWQETLNTLRGTVVDHWDEVHEIIAQGQDYVINFLKENAADYAEASKLQRDAYVEGWQQMFDKIAKAHEVLRAEILDTSGFQDTTLTEQLNSQQTKKKKGGGGGGGGSSQNPDEVQDGKDHGYSFTTMIGKQVSKNGFKTKAEAQKAAQLAYSTSSHMGIPDTIWNANKPNLGVYKNGGYIKYTGPAWVDGTKANPEYMLNAKQTKLMEGLVSALDMVVHVPRMSGFDGTSITNTNNGTTINGGIIIQVDQLATDDDYEQIANKVKESIVNAMTRGKSVMY